MRGTVAAVSCNDVYSFTKPVRDEITLIAGLGVAGDVHAGVTVRHRSRVAADPDQPNLRQVHLIRSELHEELRAAGYEVPAGGLGENVTTTGIDPLALPVGTILRFGPPPAPEAGFTSEPSASEPAEPAASEPAVAGPPDGAAAVVAAAESANLDTPTRNAVTALAARIASERAALPGQGPASVKSSSPEQSPTTAGQSAASDPASTPDLRPAVMITGLRNPCQQINDYRPGLLKQVLTREPDGTLNRRAGAMAVVLRGGVVRPGTEIHVELPAGPHVPLDRV